MINIEDNEQETFINVLKTEQTIGNKPVNVVDIMKKYKLKHIAKSNKMYNNMFSGFSSIITIIIIIAIILLIKRYCSKKHNKERKSETFVQMSNIVPPGNSHSVEENWSDETSFNPSG